MSAASWIDINPRGRECDAPTKVDGGYGGGATPSAGRLALQLRRGGRVVTAGRKRTTFRQAETGRTGLKYGHGASAAAGVVEVAAWSARRQ